MAQRETEGIAPMYPHLAYERSNLANVTDDKGFAEFRFHKKDIARLVTAFRLPPKFICRNGTTAFADEGLCMLLRRLAYPCRYSDMIPRFGRIKPEIGLIVHTVLRYICTQFEHFLSSFQQEWLHPLISPSMQ